MSNCYYHEISISFRDWLYVYVCYCFRFLELRVSLTVNVIRIEAPEQAQCFRFNVEVGTSADCHMIYVHIITSDCLLVVYIPH